MAVCCQQRRHLADDLHMRFPAPAFGEPIDLSSDGSPSTAVLLGRRIIHLAASE